MTSVLIKRKHLKTHAHTQVRTPLEVMLLQANDHQRVPANYQVLGVRPGTGSPSQLQKEATL